MIQFKEKFRIKRPWMEGLTSCVILKNLFILNKKLMKRPEMKGRTVCVMLKNYSFQRESLNKAPVDGGVDVLRHFEKIIYEI